MSTTPPCRPCSPHDCRTPSKRPLPSSPSFLKKAEPAPAACESPSTHIDDKENQCFDLIWEEARMCEEELANEESDYSSTDEEDDDCCPAVHKRPVMVRMPCGDIHLCGAGMQCPYLESNEDRVMVCKYSGIEFGPEHTDEFFDLNGGTGKRSGDPDQNAGEPVYGKFHRRIDPIAASKAAFQASNSMSDTQIAVYIPSDAASKKAKRGTCKRGALCVGETADGSRSAKRGRTSKKNVQDREICVNLHAEADSVLGKLVNYELASSFKKKRVGERMSRNKPPLDARMCDETFVFNSSVKKYVRLCISNGTAPTLDALNNLAMMAREVSLSTRRELVADTRDALRTAKFRNAFCGLVVALWSSACQSPYMKNAKRGTDAYRPFVCGVIYSTKRGLFLGDGTEVVPRCEQLSLALPVLRGTGGNSLAKTLHSSSHRGRCTLSRCIASVPISQQTRVFADAIRLAKQFSKQTFTSSDI